MVVVTVMVVIMVMVVIVLFCPGLVAVISYEADTKDTGDDRGNKADDGPDNSSDESKERVRDQNRVRTCFRRRYQEKTYRTNGTRPYCASRQLPEQPSNCKAARAHQQPHLYSRISSYLHTTTAE